jgi:phosphoribosylglycinamide formyltransferase-1
VKRQRGDAPCGAAERWEERPRLAVLLSGSGRTLANLTHAIERGELEAEIAIVVSSKPGVRGLEVAERAGIPAVVVDRRVYPDDRAFSDAVFAAIAPHRPHLIVLAGFLRRIVVDEAWQGRILNIHPALLPEMAQASGRGFYGDRVHEEVLRSGARTSGATVHIVDNEYDRGPAIARIEVEVRGGDTVEMLAARVFDAECRLYPAAIAAYLEANRWWLPAAGGQTAPRLPSIVPQG